MKIGIIGSGNMGAALGKKWAEHNHQVKFSYSTDSEKLKKLGSFNDQTSFGTVEEVVNFGDVLMISVPSTSLAEVFAKPELFKNKILITCVSGLRPDFEGNTIGLGTDLQISIAETIANLAPDTHVVEAFNTTFAQIIEQPTIEGHEKPNVFLCGDDNQAKSIVSTLIRDCGYEPFDAGVLKISRSLETFATAWVQLAAVSNLFPQFGIKIVKK